MHYLYPRSSIRQYYYCLYFSGKNTEAQRENMGIFTKRVNGGRIFIHTMWAGTLLGMLCFSSVQFSHSVVSDSVTPWIAARQASLSITNSWSSLRLVSIESVMPSSHLILSRPLPLLPPVPPSIKSLFQWVRSSYEVARVLEFQLQHHSFQRNPRADLLQSGPVGSWSPRDSQESSPAPQFKSINSLVLSLLHSPTHIHTWPQEKP